MASMADDIRSIVEQVLKSPDFATLLGESGTAASGTAAGAGAAAQKLVPGRSPAWTARWLLPRLRSGSW